MATSLVSFRIMFYRNVCFKMNVEFITKGKISSLSRVHSKHYSSDVQESKIVGVEKFKHPEVQRILKKVTGFDTDKIFRRQKTKLEPPAYQLVSDEKLKEMQEKAQKEAEERLQMPPILPEREPCDKVLSEDPTISGLFLEKMVFTDISANLNNRKRFMVVREPDGVLRTASWEERGRILQKYFPSDDVKIEAPPMFEEKNMNIYFKADRHEILLDAACMQFEPDAAEFIQICEKVYEEIDATNKYDLLHSTRHFGGMTFYLARHKRIEGVLLYKMQNEMISDAADLVRLYHILYPDTEAASRSTQQGVTDLQILKDFTELEARSKGMLELAIQSYEAGMEAKSKSVEISQEAVA